MESAKVYAFKIGDSIKNFASDMSEKIKSLFGQNFLQNYTTVFESQ